jgi:beta-phosphoglucomutase-like phosphatase (HAD superfamily)
VEDSTNGIRAAKAGGMRVVAVPQPEYPPQDDAIPLADAVLHSLVDLIPALERIA